MRSFSPVSVHCVPPVAPEQKAGECAFVDNACYIFIKIQDPVGAAEVEPMVRKAYAVVKHGRVVCVVPAPVILQLLPFAGENVTFVGGFVDEGTEIRIKIEQPVGATHLEASGIQGPPRWAGDRKLGRGLVSVAVTPGPKGAESETPEAHPMNDVDHVTGEVPEPLGASDVKETVHDRKGHQLGREFRLGAAGHRRIGHR